MPNHAIVYLDGNPTERSNMEAALRATWDNPVLSFATGDALKHYLEGTPVEDWPHVLFLDLDLDGRDLTGYDIVRWLKETYAHVRTPVTVVVTGEPEREAMVKAREAGARYYVVRPATQESLFAIIRRERSLSNVLMRNHAHA
jgi:DNA-binding response OmpR family regulator